MFTKLSKKINAVFFLCALLISVLATETIARVDYSTGRTKCPSSPEMMTLRELGLSEDVGDSEIIRLLDVPDKRLSAITLIRYRKISSAAPKLLKIVNDANNSELIFEKIWAAGALCDFGNREWMQTIKTLSIDPNGMINWTSHKYEVAGLLARAGDFSQFEIVAKGISDSKDYIRSTAIYQLRNFGHKVDSVTDSAVKLLTSVAMSDPIPWLRDRAIESLETIAKKKPEVTAKVIDVLEANKDSSDKNLRIMCRAKLKMYDKKSKTKDK